MINIMGTPWINNFIAVLLIPGSIAIIVDIHPRENIVVPRQNVTFLCRVGVPLQYCRVEIPGLGTRNLNPKLSPKEGVSYYGAGLSAGQCGFTIDSVKEENNGKVKCFLGIETETQEPFGTMHLTVARAPKAPELDVSRGTDSVRVYKRHDVLQASCIVRDGRPAANISWYLDDEPLYGDGLSMPTELNLAKDDLHSKVQNLTRVLQASDNGKNLRCVARHPALPGGESVAARQLDVKYPPLPLSNPIDKFGYELGKAGTISVEIDANPKPQLQWGVRDQLIKEGNIDGTGRIEAESARDLGRGRYVANLRIAAITKQDTETQYILTAYNDMGTQDYTVLISTSPEPEGFEFSVASIIGIIIFLLFVLLAIFIVIFARVKGRWCFSGGTRVIDYTVGEGVNVQHPQQQHTLGNNGNIDGVDNPHHLVHGDEYIVNGRVEKRTATETSDTESTDIRPKSERRIFHVPKVHLPEKLKSVFRKDRIADTLASPSDELDDGKSDPAASRACASSGTVESTVSTDQAGIVYAELDLVNANMRALVKSPEEDKTEYAEIVYALKDAQKKSDDKPAEENTTQTNSAAVTKGTDKSGPS